MHKIAKQAIVLFLITALLFATFGSSAIASVDFEKEDPTGCAMFVDFILVRPVGIVALVAGSVLFVISLPFSALGRNVKAAVKSLVIQPAKFTFTRPLGEF